jgi:hypothetical protein
MKMPKGARPPCQSHSNLALGLAAFVSWLSYIVPDLKRAGKAGKLEEVSHHARGFDISVRRFPVLRSSAHFFFLHTDRLPAVARRDKVNPI